MRLVVTIVGGLILVGLAAFGLVLAQKGATPIATATSTVRIASATQEVSALPTRAPVSQIVQATVSEASPLLLQADVDVQSGSPLTTVPQAPSPVAAAPNVKDQSPSTISKAMVHETARLKDDATGWAHKLQELELDLKLQLDLKKNQDVEAKSRVQFASWEEACNAGNLALKQFLANNNLERSAARGSSCASAILRGG